MLYRFFTFTLLLVMLTGCAQHEVQAADIVPGALVVVYRQTPSLATPEALTSLVRPRKVQYLSHLNLSVLHVAPGTENIAMQQLRSNHEVANVLRDRYVKGHAMHVRPLVPIVARPARPISVPPVPAPNPVSSGPISPRLRPSVPRPTLPSPDLPRADATYISPQGWSVRQAGGFGDNLDGTTIGPWNMTRGAGIRIAILDSGIDANHPDLSPNLAVNLSEVDQTALPSPCDDGSPQDQQGHGTWVASLAAAAFRFPSARSLISPPAMVPVGRRHSTAPRTLRNSKASP